MFLLRYLLPFSANCADLNKNPLWAYEQTCQLTGEDPPLLTADVIKNISSLPLSMIQYMDGNVEKTICQYAALEAENITLKNAVFIINFKQVVPTECDEVKIGLFSSLSNGSIVNVTTIVNIFLQKYDQTNPLLSASFSLVINAINSNISNSRVSLDDYTTNSTEPTYLSISQVKIVDFASNSYFESSSTKTLLYSNISVQICENETQRELDYPTIPSCVMIFPIDQSAGSGTIDTLKDNIIQCHSSFLSQYKGSCYENCYFDSFRCYYGAQYAIGCENLNCKCFECPVGMFLLRDSEITGDDYMCVASCDLSNITKNYYIWNMKFCVGECQPHDYIWKNDNQLVCVQECPAHLSIGNKSGSFGYTDKIFLTHLACVECETSAYYQLVVQNGFCVMSCYETYVLTQEGACAKYCSFDQTPVTMIINNISQLVCQFCHQINGTYSNIENLTLTCVVNCKPKVHGENMSCLLECPSGLLQNPDYQCVENCSIFQYKNDTHCMDECPDGFYINLTAMTCTEDCPLDKFKNEKFCVDLCPIGFLPNDAAECSKCKDYFDEVNKLCVAICDSKLFQLINGIKSCWSGPCNWSVVNPDGSKQCSGGGNYQAVLTQIIPIQQTCGHMFSTAVWNLGCTMINESISGYSVINVLNYSAIQNFNGKGGCLYYFLNMSDSFLSDKIINFQFQVNISEQCVTGKFVIFNNLINSQLNNINVTGNIRSDKPDIFSSNFAYLSENSSQCAIKSSLKIDGVNLTTSVLSGSLSAHVSCSSIIFVTKQSKFSFNFKTYNLLFQSSFNSSQIDSEYSLQDSCNEMQADIKNLEEFYCNSSTHRCFFGFMPMICANNCSCRYCSAFSTIDAANKFPPMCTNSTNCPSGTFLQGILCVSKCDDRYLTYGYICLLQCPDGMVEENRSCFPCGSLYAHRRDNICVAHCDDYVHVNKNCETSCPEGRIPYLSGNRILCKNCSGTDFPYYFQGFCYESCATGQVQLNYYCFEQCPYGLMNESGLCVMECNNSLNEDYICTISCHNQRYNDTRSSNKQCRQNCSFFGPFSSYIGYPHCVNNCSIAETLNNFSRKCISICQEGTELNTVTYQCDICQYWRRSNESCQISACQFLNISVGINICEEINTHHCQVIFEGLCSDECLLPTLYIDFSYVCVAFCPSLQWVNRTGMLYCYPLCENSFILHSDSQKQCVDNCPLGWNQSGLQCINYSCTVIPTYQFNNNGICVERCSFETTPNIFTNLTTMNCSNRCSNGYENGTFFICSDSCKFWIFNQSMFQTKICFNFCPIDYPYVLLDGMCVLQCPSSQFLDNKKCVLSCNESSFVFYDDVNNICLQTCPNDHPLLDGKYCTNQCSSLSPFVLKNNSIFKCVAQCNNFYTYTTIPDFSKQLNLCVEVCAEFVLNFGGKQCIASCPSNFFIFIQNLQQFCVQNCSVHKQFYYQYNNSCVPSCKIFSLYYFVNSSYYCVQNCSGLVNLDKNEYYCSESCPKDFGYSNMQINNINVLLCQSCNKFTHYNNSLLLNQCLDNCDNLYQQEMNSSICISSCSNFIFRNSSTNFCISNCSQSIIHLYHNQTHCIANCSKYFVSELNPFLCIDKCPKYFYNDGNFNICVSSCPHYIENSSCVDSCSIYFPHVDNFVCRMCPFHKIVDGVKMCLNQSCTNYNLYHSLQNSQICVSSCPKFAVNSLNSYCNDTCSSLFYKASQSQLVCQISCVIYEKSSIFGLSYKLCLDNCSQFLHLNGECNSTPCIQSFNDKKQCVTQCSASYHFVSNNSGTFDCVSICPQNQFVVIQQFNQNIKLCSICSAYQIIDLVLNASSCVDHCFPPMFINNTYCQASCGFYVQNSTNLYCFDNCKHSTSQFAYNNTCVDSCSALNLSIGNISSYSCVDCQLIQKFNDSETICISSCLPTQFVHQKYCIDSCSTFGLFANFTTRICQNCSHFFISNSINYCLNSCAGSDYPIHVFQSDQCIQKCDDFIFIVLEEKYCNKSCSTGHFIQLLSSKQCVENCNDYDVETIVSGLVLCSFNCSEIIHLDKTCSADSCDNEGFYDQEQKKCVQKCSHFVITSDAGLVCADSCPNGEFIFVQHRSLSVGNFKQCSQCQQYKIQQDIGYECVSECNWDINYLDKMLCENCTNSYVVNINSVQYCINNCSIVDYFHYVTDYTCVPSCQNTSLPFVKDSFCVDQCVYYLKNNDSQYFCYDNCSRFYQLVSYNNSTLKVCQTECDSYFIQELVMRQCINSCPNFVLNLGGFQCNSTCNNYQYNQDAIVYCVSDCQLTVQKYHYQQQCLNSCKENNLFIKQDSLFECVSLCDQYIRQNNHENICVSACSKDEFISNAYCVDFCPANQFPDEFSKVCRACNFYYIKSSIQFCADDCQLTAYPFQSNNQCVSICPFFVSNNICVDRCPSLYFENISGSLVCGNQCAIYKYYETASQLHYQCIERCDQILQLNGSCSANNCQEGHFLKFGACVENCSNFVVLLFNGSLQCNDTCEFNSYQQINISSGSYHLCKPCDQYSIAMGSYWQCEDICIPPMFISGDNQTLCQHQCNKFVLGSEKELMFCYTQCPVEFSSILVQDGISYCVSKCPQFVDDQFLYCLDSCSIYVLEKNGVRRCTNKCDFYLINDTDSAMCTESCPANQVILNKFCSQKCELGQYINNKVCVSTCSPPSQFIDFSQKLCLSNCSIGFVQNLTGFVCVQQCLFYYLVNQSKQCFDICPPNYEFYIVDYNQCLQSCPTGYFIRNSTICVLQCDKGQFIKNSVCLDDCADFVLNQQCINVCPSAQKFVSVLGNIKNCVSICSKFVNETGFCVDSCPSLNYRVINGSKYCTSSCNLFYIQDLVYRMCVDDCVSPYMIQVTECVLQCTVGAKVKENNLIYCKKCDFYIDIDGFCVEKCPSFISLQYCVDSCPDYTIIVSQVCVVFQCNGTILNNFYCIPTCLNGMTGLSNNSCVQLCPGGQFTGLVSCQPNNQDKITETTITDDRVEFQQCTSPRILVGSECILFLCPLNQWYWATQCHSFCSGIKYSGVCFPSCSYISQNLVYFNGQCLDKCPVNYIAIDGFCLKYSGSDQEWYPGNGTGGGSGSGGSGDSGSGSGSGGDHC